MDDVDGLRICRQLPRQAVAADDLPEPREHPPVSHGLPAGAGVEAVEPAVAVGEDAEGEESGVLREPGGFDLEEVQDRYPGVQGVVKADGERGGGDRGCAAEQLAVARRRTAAPDISSEPASNERREPPTALAESAQHAHHPSRHPTKPQVSAVRQDRDPLHLVRP